ncbi:MAG: hypothetical protein R3E13_06855 [Alphaproteobacteria bacterium]
MDDSEIKALEEKACWPEKVRLEDFNPDVQLPHGLKAEHICSAMNEFIDFIGFIGQQLHGRDIPRLESMLMPANFSSIVGEFVTTSIPKYCDTIVRNQYHNGHPDMIPAGMFQNDAVQHSPHGIEVKGSRYLKGWQGHNAEDAWLMVFCFDSNRPVDEAKNIPPKPFEYLMVVGAQLEQSDWTFAGRSETSRRTITASVNKSGYEKMMSNWIYKSPNLKGKGDLL